LAKSLEQSHPKDSIVRKLYSTLTQLHRQLKRTDDALRICTKGRELYPDDSELLFVESLLRREKRDFAGAEQCLKRLLEHREGDHFASVDTGIRGYKARHNLAVLYMDMERLDDAATAWREVLAEEPNFIPAHAGLGELAIKRKDGGQLDTILDAMNRMGSQGAIESAALRARYLMTTEKFAAARWTLLQALNNHPNALILRILHSHAILKEGKEPQAAEAALNAVLELDPNNQEAHSNLAVLRVQEKDKRK
jgi:tetratricopeptide (TPR) repeat protein